MISAPIKTEAFQWLYIQIICYPHLLGKYEVYPLIKIIHPAMPKSTTASVKTRVYNGSTSQSYAATNILQASMKYHCKSNCPSHNAKYAPGKKKELYVSKQYATHPLGKYEVSPQIKIAKLYRQNDQCFAEIHVREDTIHDPLSFLWSGHVLQIKQHKNIGDIRLF